MRALPYRTPRRMAVYLDDHLIAGGWIGLDDPQIAGWRVQDGAIHIPLWVARGFHTLRLEALDGCTDYPFALTCWKTPDLSPDCAPADPPACISAAFELPTWEAAESLPVPYEGQAGISLRGYTLAVEDGAVSVRLFWDGARDADYALFVHVSDPQTNVPAAQFTGFPPVPTSEWDGDTRWVNDVRIALDGLSSGTYAINVGWFQPETHEQTGLLRLETIVIP